MVWLDLCAADCSWGTEKKIMLDTLTRRVYDNRFKFQDGSGGEFHMDGKKAQLSGSCGGQRGPSEIRSIPSRGRQMVGGREYEMLLAEGHYRCPHCRPAGSDEKNVTTTRMR